MISRLLRDDRGSALLSVIGGSTVLVLVVVTLVATTQTQIRGSRAHQDENAALAAAQAGVDDYLYRLNRNDAYWQRADPTNRAADYEAGEPVFVPVPGRPNAGTFHYDVDAGSYGSVGVLRLTSTGQVGDEERTVSTTLRRRGFLDYLYFTDYETTDPFAYADESWANIHCKHHRSDVWRDPQGSTQTGRNSLCRDIYWYSTDVLDGPFHTNDTVAVVGTPTWRQNASTSWADPAGTFWYDRSAALGSGASNPSFLASPNDRPTYATPLTMPPSNSALRREADPTVGGQGCLYQGPTRIRLLPNGRVDVRSPTTTLTRAGCATNGEMALPTNGVIFVDSLPSTASTNCPSHPFPRPAGDLTRYDCRAGDVFVQGQLNGRLTIGATNNIVVTGDTTYVGGTGGQSILGLVAQNFVEVYHPVRCTTTTSGSCNLDANPDVSGTQLFSEPRIHAAILSVAHSFRVQNHGRGERLGTLHVVGAIAQIYRGPVGTFGTAGQATGYAKDYVYDARFQSQSPPYFIDPVRASWGVTEFTEQVG